MPPAFKSRPDKGFDCGATSVCPNTHWRDGVATYGSGNNKGFGEIDGEWCESIVGTFYNCCFACDEIEDIDAAAGGSLLPGVDGVLQYAKTPPQLCPVNGTAKPWCDWVVVRFPKASSGRS